ncbi:MAG: hypothetical protein E7673_02415 [Ruminococcaceae bacterium]|nr:hypothetical protein [Oscillospiraceae bacterium]
MLGSLMFISKIVMEILPNIHLLGMLTMVYTLVFRVRALIPIYIYVLLNGVYSGFSMWWFPYTYIWTILFLITLLLPKKMPKVLKMVVYPTVCAVHGFAFGALYSPAQALMFGFDFKQTVAWIIAGIPFDLIHGVSNFVMGLLVLPFSELLEKLYNRKYA